MDAQPLGTGGGCWRWVGTELPARLGSDFEVRVFEKADIHTMAKGSPLHWADVWMVVKNVRCLDRMPKGRPLVFLPVDAFHSPEDITNSAAGLARCHTIVAHNEELVPYLQGKHRRIVYLDHHYLDAFDGVKEYDPKSPVLWVGVDAYAPGLIAWYQHHRPSWATIGMTNGRGRRAIQAAGLGDLITLEKWRAETHRTYMERCTFAIDFKDDSFFQRTKPHTKAAGYLASGVALAVPLEHRSRSFFYRRFGLRLAVPDTDHWMSRAYFDEVQIARPLIRQELNVEAVATKFASILRGVVT